MVSLSFLIYYAPNPVWCTNIETVVQDNSCNHFLNRSNVMSYEKTEKDILFRTIVGGGLGILLF